MYVRIFGYLAYGHVHKSNMRTKYRDPAVLGMYVGLTYGLLDVHIPERRDSVAKKHITCDETVFPSAEKKYKEIGSFYDDNFTFEVITNERTNEEANLQTEASFVESHLMSQKDRNKVGDNECIKTLAGRGSTLKDRSIDRRDAQNNNVPENVAPTVNEDTLKGCYSDRECWASTRSTLNALTRARIDEYLSPRDALRGFEAAEGQEALKTEIQTVKKMNCQIEIPRPSHEKVLHSKFVLKRKRDYTGHIAKCKALSVTCGNEDTENNVDGFPLFRHSRCLVMSIVKQRNWDARCYDMQNAFPMRNWISSCTSSYQTSSTAMIIGGIISLSCIEFCIG